MSPDLPSARLRSVNQARWRADAITLADAARIAFPGVPNPPPGPVAARNAALARATVANRRLLSTWVPVLRAVAPRLTGLAGSHLYLAPGHGFFPRPSTSTQADEWRSERSVGYALEAGEDENDALMAREVDRIVLRNGMRVSAPRELRDLTLQGVSQPAANRWQVVPGDGFLRLWQQNPLSYLGSRRDPAVVGTFLGNVPRDRRVNATIARVEHAARLAADPDDPIDLYLGVHTNGGEFPGGGPPVFLAVRGAEVLFVDVHSTAADLANAAEEGNTMGLGYARRLLTEIVNRCGMLNRGTRSVRANGVSNYELQQTFPHFEQDAAGPRWQHGRLIDATGAPTPPAWIDPPFAAGSAVGVFPRAIPVALAEIAFHTSDEECRMLREGWFRRVAGEAMAIATEDQVTADTAPIDRGHLRTLLIGVFGATDAIRGLPADDGALDGDVSPAPRPPARGRRRRRRPRRSAPP